jgi:SPASM domain peptide maturase of grasp-with-spasm system
MKKFFCLFSDCKIVKGENRSLIIDLTNNKYFYIPNSMEFILKKFIGSDYLTFIKSYNEKEQTIINEYFIWLEEENIGFWATSKQEFTSFNISNDSFIRPYILDNCIIEYNQMFDLNSILDQIVKINIPFIEIRFYDNVSYNFISNFLQYIKYSNIEGIDLILKYNKNFKIYNYKKIIINELRLNNLIITNYKTNKIIEYYRGLSKLKFVTKKIENNIHCGMIDSKYFTNNKLLYSESQHHNTCLNRKISIDVNGNIKNCPSMPQSFGNIKDTTLEQALEHPDFKKYWNITKDQIEVCKDCEFRHICTDCRAYTERTHFQEDIDLSKPLKCGYNPYTNEWAEWSTNPLKQKAIEYYGMQELVKKDA